MKTLIFHPFALEEAESIQSWYKERSSRAAELFLKELSEHLNLIQNAPQQYPIFVQTESGHQLRRKIFTRFPYLLIYSIRENSIHIIAVAHQRRKPLYWLERVY